MQRFAQLYEELDQTTRTAEKVAALRRYFQEADPACAAWALYILTGRRLTRAVSSRLLRQWVCDETGVPPWFVDECYGAVGDLAETLALLVQGAETPINVPLREIIEQRVMPLRHASEQEKRHTVVQTWRELDKLQLFLYHKLLSGEFRVGVAQTLVIRAFGEAASVPQAVMTHRLMGGWKPTADEYRRLLAPGDAAEDPARPYPFFLAHPLDRPLADLGNPADWRAEWKWDGIRAQMIRRGGEGVLWSRGQEILNPQFPELVQASAALPDGVVLDGEIVAWEEGRPLAFQMLQRRLNRKRVQPSLWPDVPVAFLAFDLLEWQGRDIRARSQDARREQLADLLNSLGEHSHLRLSPTVPFDDWDDLTAQHATAREQNAEGLMLKGRASTYGVGRERGTWWKWKLEPYRLDAVLMYAQRGHGRRAGLFTDYTFGVWSKGELVPVARAYSGLTDEEIREVDRLIRQLSTGRHGPLRSVEPKLVFELAFQGVQRSRRHKAGLALRFPRIARWRRDKTPQDADDLPMVQSCLQESSNTSSAPPPARGTPPSVRSASPSVKSASASNPRPFH